VQIWVDADACPNLIKEILFRRRAPAGPMILYNTLLGLRRRLIRAMRVRRG
jgi:uncharacterized protein YaiI (UPF0178 family)